jgi:predicted secreted protein
MLVTNSYEPRKNKERLVGSGGVEHWIFKVVEKGRVELALKYVRPLEKEAVGRTKVIIVCE